MPVYIQGAGPYPMLGATTTGSTSVAAGTWIPVHPRARNITFQLTHSSCAGGTTVQSTVTIQASNDGVNPLLESLASIVCTSGTPEVHGFTNDAHYNYVRANVLSISTGSIQVLASAILQ